MKVLLINGSPHEKGCTNTALQQVADRLLSGGIEVEHFYIGSQPVKGCIGCGKCSPAGTNACVFDNDAVYHALQLADSCDGFVFGTPVHYAGMSAVLKSFMDHFFYLGGSKLSHKPAAALATCRRGGATAALEQVNQYFYNANMPIVTSQYWCMAHGNTPEELLQDAEGVQIMQTLGSNMAWLLSSLQAGREAGIALPKKEPRQRTNFIRA